MHDSLVGRARFALVLLTLLLASGRAAAQSPESSRSGAGVTLARPRERPSLMLPVYYMLAPGAALLIVGGILWSQDDPNGESSEAHYRAKIALIGAGTTMVVGTLPYLGARITKRRRWAAQRRWEACGENCNPEEPKLYYAASMLVPGVVLMAAGIGASAHDWILSESSGDLPDDPYLGHSDLYFRSAIACAVIGTTLVVAGTVHLFGRVQLRAAWRQRGGALSRVRVRPTMGMRPGAGASYNFGLAMSARF